MSMAYNIQTNGDFKKYYDTQLKRNYWVLGYFGGGAINIVEAMDLAKQYAESTGVPLNTVCMDEILRSRRYKGFKFIYSSEKQQPEQNTEQMNNVYAWLRY